MNNPFLIALFALLFYLTGQAQSCLPNGITLKTQAEINDFQSNYPGCSVIEGNLVIEGGTGLGITDLNGLSALTRVGGSLTINSDVLQNLNGLEGLTTVGGHFNIINCHSLKDLTGLSGLVAIEGTFNIQFCDSLTSLTGPAGLTSIGADLEILYCKRLLNLDGLSNLATLGKLNIVQCDNMLNLSGLEQLTSMDGLYIENNDVLTSLGNWNGLDSFQYVIIAQNPLLTGLSGLKHLKYVKEDIQIGYNTALSSLSALDSLTRTGGNIFIRGNSALTSLNGLNHLKTIGGALELTFPLTNLGGLERLDSIGQYLYLGELKTPSLAGLNRLKYIGKDLLIFGCNALTSLAGLDSLNTIGGFLDIRNNPALASLDGLDSLKSIGGFLNIQYNSALAGLNGLNQLQDFGGPLTVTNNPTLSDCAVFPVCRLLENELNSVILQHNAPGCNSPAEIAAQCSGAPVSPFVRVAVKADPDGDCLPGANNLPVAGEQVLLTGASKMVIAGTGNDGVAWFKYPENSAGTLSLPQFPNTNWSVCQEPITFSPAASGDTIQATFLLLPLVQCPELKVHLGLPPNFRECSANSIVQVSTQNRGTVEAENVKIGVVMPAIFDLPATDPPLSSQTGDTLFFDVGNLPPFATATVNLTVRTKCNTFQTGQAFCWEAFARLQNACAAPPPQAEIRLSAVCTGDSLRFTLKNTGNAPTQNPHEYIIIRNMNRHLTANFSLAPQESLSVAVPADGATWRMEATKLEDGTLTATALENCGGLTPGLVTAFWLDKGPLDVDFDCRQVLPDATGQSQKTAVPSGIGSSHLLPANQAVQYTIHFQNTGNDTVSRVLIRDVLPQDMDISTFRPGAASHPYTWEIRNGNTLEVLFPAIILPDSNTNKEASRGFLSYSLAQNPNLPVGTYLSNAASVAFDFGLPVPAYPVTHRIGDPYPPDHPCGADGIYFGDQQEVDQFSANYPGCRVIVGGVTIGSGISNLNGLSQVTSMGSLKLQNMELTNLTGLDNLVYCGGLFIEGNALLENLSGLNSLKTVGTGGIYVANNAALTGLGGLNNVQSVGGSVTLSNNPLLANLNSLDSLASVGGDFMLSNCSAVPDFTGLGNLSKISQTLSVISNGNLTSFSGLENLDTIGGDFIVENGAAVVLDSLNQLKWIGGNFSVTQNNILGGILGLGSLDGIGGSLMVINNSTIVEISGMNQLRAIGASIFLDNNAQLYSIGGLKNLISVAGNIQITANPALASLSGLDRLETVGGDFLVLANSMAAGLNSLDSLRHIGGYLNIVGNPGLPALNGLRQLSTIGGVLGLNNNPNLVDLSGLEQLDSTGRGVYLEENAALISLNGLSSLRFIGEELIVSRNGKLAGLNGLESLQTVGSNLLIFDNAILTGLNGLEALRTVGGDLLIGSNPALTSLNGLGNLDSMGGSVRILSNASLTTLNGFQKLKKIASKLVIENNAALLNLEGLNQIATVGEELSIRNNSVLPGLNGLNGLKYIAQNFTVEFNGLLNFNGLQNLDSIGGDVWIYGNNTLQSYQGLSSLKSIGGNFKMEENTGLQTLDGLNQLTTVGGQLWIAYHNGMNNLQGLNNLKTIGSDVYIHASPNLTNLNGLNGLTSIPGNVWIQFNGALTDLSGLNNLVAIGGLLDIESNTALSTLAGLENLTTLGYLALANNPALASLSGLDKLSTLTGDQITISGNPNLSECSIYAICDFLNNMQGLANIYNNAPGCNTPAEVEALCNSIPVVAEVRLDNNGNCQSDAADAPAAGVHIRLEGMAQMLLKPTDNLGITRFGYLENGPFSLHLPQFPAGYWNVCQEPILLDPGGSTDTIRTTFLLSPVAQCPELTVQLGMPSFFRGCLVTSDMEISVQNTGAVNAEGVKVAVVLPPVLELLAAAPPLDAQVGDTLYFDLGTVLPFGKTAVMLTVRTKCDTFLFSQTLCVETFATLDNPCPTTLPAFSEIKLSAGCIGDTLARFILKNIGDAPTQGPHTYTIIRNETVIQTENFSLVNQQSMAVDVPADGATYRMEATKFDNGSLTATAQENCGGLTPGLITAFWLDKGPFEYDFDCRQVIGSYDPNLKSAVPTGAGLNYTITANRPIQYTIDFQNTGTDTAYRVLLRDVLPAAFDLNTFRAGFSSHPCTWEIRGNTLDVLFFPIVLPDSNVNEPASRGFFSFDLDQKPDLPDGTFFQNSAAIIFDFNPPIITNTVYHTIGKLTVDIDEPQRFADLWQVAGNPTRDAAAFSALTFIGGEKRFELYDAAGRPVRAALFSGQSFVFQRDMLPDGVYFFRIGDERGKWFTGKIVVID